MQYQKHDVNRSDAVHGVQKSKHFKQLSIIRTANSQWADHEALKMAMTPPQKELLYTEAGAVGGGIHLREIKSSTHFSWTRNRKHERISRDALGTH